jgi:phosphoglycolate phosphatase
VTNPLLMLDYDGVVVDSLEIFVAAFTEACRHAGVPRVASAEDVLALFEGNVFEGLRDAGADEQSIRAILGRATGALRVALPAMRPFPLMPEVLGELALVRHLAIVTSNVADVVDSFLRRHGIAGIAEVAGAEVGEGKVAKIERLMARFPGQRVYWFVGDTAGDMREARLAGAIPLGVAWGWHDPARLEKAGAEAIAETPADLLTMVAPEIASDFFGTG